MTEEVLEELYELLELYFDIPVVTGTIRAYERHFYIEPGLENVERRDYLRMEILKRIRKINNLLSRK